MVSGLTPPSKRDNENTVKENIDYLRDTIRFAPSTRNASDVGGFFGNSATQTGAISGQFAITPIECIESVMIQYTESSSITDGLRIGDVVSTTANSWTGKLVFIDDDKVGDNSAVKKAVFEPTNVSAGSFSDTNQTLSKTNWSAAYTTGQNPSHLTSNIVMASGSTVIVKKVDTSYTTTTVKTVNGMTNNGGVITIKPKEGKSLTLGTGGNIDISSNVTIADDEFAILQFFDDASGKFLLVKTGTGSGSGTSFIGFTADADLNMGTRNIDGLDQLIFSTGSSSDDPLGNTAYGIEADGGTSPTGIRYNVPSSKEHKFYVNGSLKATIDSNGLDAGDIGSGTVNVARLGTGASSSKFLRGDNTWQTVSGGGTSFIGFTADANLDMNDRNIEDVNSLKINSGSANSSDALTIFGTSSAGVINLVDDSDDFIIQVDSAAKLKIEDQAFTFMNQDGLTISGENNSGNSALTFGSSIIATGTRDIGSSSTGDRFNNLWLNGNANVAGYVICSGTGGNNDFQYVRMRQAPRFDTTGTGPTSAGTYNGNVLSPDGYIEIKVGSSTKVIPYY